ncbi:MAG: COG4315 family predicted lipoprotein, partial [Silanimonas sp.]
MRSIVPLLLRAVVGAATSAIATPPAPSVGATAPSAAADVIDPRAALLARALASPVPAWRRGDLLVDRLNRGLYTYGPDEPGRSHCDLNCRRYWPPLYAEPGAKPVGPFTLATGEEGRPIWAWRGRPLYRWTGDRGRGSARGEVVNEWFLVRI